MSFDSSLTLHPSDRHEEWVNAYQVNDYNRLGKLALRDDPFTALYELEAFINGLYAADKMSDFMMDVLTGHKGHSGTSDHRDSIIRIIPIVKEIRERLGWHIREFDIALLRLIRRSHDLSLVLGAGVSMGAGAPSWPELVRLLLKHFLSKGYKIYGSKPAADNPTPYPFELLPDGKLRITTEQDGTLHFESYVKEEKQFTPEEEQIARTIVDEIELKGSEADVENLMKGAQLCFDLSHLDLFQVLTKYLYKDVKEPSKTHRAIAELARDRIMTPQGERMYPGWEKIISYNFDSLMSIALLELQVPHAAYYMRGSKFLGDPDELARKGFQHLPIYHLHGYAPSHLFRITDIQYVFSTSQYTNTYKGPESEIFQNFHELILANPIHIAIYIGCSFSDESMNELLRKSFNEYPGRHHYAFLQWPYKRKGRIPASSKLKIESSKYLEFGVRPIWFDDFEELPDLIRQLK